MSIIWSSTLEVVLSLSYCLLFLMSFFYIIKEFCNTGDLFYIGVLRRQVERLLINNQILIQGIDSVELKHKKCNDKSYDARHYSVDGFFL